MSVRIFFKIDVLAIREGRLISKVGADGWATLCAIASFMDEDGVCYPTQETLADLMGVTRQAANARIGRLLKITMEDGSPLLERSWKGHGLSKRSVYRINKACGVFMGRELDMSDDAPRLMSNTVALSKIADIPARYVVKIRWQAMQR